MNTLIVVEVDSSLQEYGECDALPEGAMLRAVVQDGRHAVLLDGDIPATRVATFAIKARPESAHQVAMALTPLVRRVAEFTPNLPDSRCAVHNDGSTTWLKPGVTEYLGLPIFVWDNQQAKYVPLG